MKRFETMLDVLPSFQFHLLDSSNALALHLACYPVASFNSICWIPAEAFGEDLVAMVVQTFQFHLLDSRAPPKTVNSEKRLNPFNSICWIHGNGDGKSPSQLHLISFNSICWILAGASSCRLGRGTLAFNSICWIPRYKPPGMTLYSGTVTFQFHLLDSC